MVKGQNKVRALVSIAMLSSIAYVLMLVNFPIPPFPNFLKIDFSDLPALIGALIFGPMAAILVELLKNILDYFMTGSETGVPVGHIANFIAGLLYILPTYYIYNKIKTKKGMSFALIVGSILMSVIMSVLNYYIILPAYTYFLNFPAMSAAEIRQYIVAGILPFNLIKGLAMSLVFMILFTKMGTWLKKQASYNEYKINEYKMKKI
ncbi:ECF transporter S component [Niallia oryzisoli]|uniref:Riboflavin transporter n=1 Tax=Niallia oryzisoli TaxID=1737571 RepID=A0ABZ2CP16_9BACI